MTLKILRNLLAEWEELGRNCRLETIPRMLMHSSWWCSHAVGILVSPNSNTNFVLEEVCINSIIYRRPIGYGFLS